jgi:hypothetical protein
MGYEKLSLSGKRAALLHQILIHIILVAAILGIFLMSSVGRTTSNQVRQQLVEKQLALFIGAAEPGMDFIIYSIGPHGKISDLKLVGGRVYVYINNGKISEGYPYYSRYEVNRSFDNPGGELNDRYIISIR